MKHLTHILDFLIYIDHLIAQVSCPNSQKKKAKYPQGFQCYIMAHDQESVQMIQAEFERFQQLKDKPFKKLEINPRSKADIAAEEASRSQSMESAIPSFVRAALQEEENVANCESPPEIMTECFAVRPCASADYTADTITDIEETNDNSDYWSGSSDNGDYSRQGSLVQGETNL